MESHPTSTQAPRPGSIKNRVVASDLEEERLKANFNSTELSEAWWGDRQTWEEYKDLTSLIDSDPVLRNTNEWYDMTREEQWETLFKKARRFYEIDKKRFYTEYKSTYIPWYSAGV